MRQIISLSIIIFFISCEGTPNDSKTPTVAEEQRQIEYVKSVLDMVKSGDHSNNYNIESLKKEINNLDKISEGIHQVNVSIMTFSFDEYKIVKSSDDQVVVHFKYPDRSFDVPSKWTTERTFELVDTPEGFKLNYDTSKNSNFVYVYFYKERQLEFEPDKSTDFSSNFLTLESSNKTLWKEVEKEYDSILSNDLTDLFMEGSKNLEGAIGGYKRLQVHYSRFEKVNDKKYSVTGLSRASNNVCDFTGTLEIIKALKFKEVWELDKEEPSNNLVGGVILSRMNLKEDQSQTGSGIFEGIHCIYWYFDKNDKVIKLHNLNGYSDSYRNNTFVGLWKSHSSSSQQKAIWGIGRLPYIEDLDIGAGDISINKKYVENGWNEEDPNWWEE